MNKKLLLFFASPLLGVNLTAHADNRSIEEMTQAAQEILQKTDIAHSRSMKSRAITPQIIETRGQFSIIGYQDGGYAVVTHDNELPAVLGYSDNTYTEAINNPVFRSFIDSYDGYLNYCASNQITPRFINQKVKLGHPEGVPEIMTCRWSQYNPYNFMAPYVDYKGEPTNCVTGCVATAMAQVFYTINKKFGIDITSHGRVVYNYVCDDNNLRTWFRRDLTPVTTEWEDLADTYDNTSPYAQNIAVASLMYQCGMAASMMYAYDAGSGTYQTDALYAINNHFDGITGTFSGYGKLTNYSQQIYDAFDAGLPVILSGQNDEDYGHAFVGDGYDSEGRIHLNLGWGGVGNDYFAIADMSGYKHVQSVLFVTPTDRPTTFSAEDPIEELQGKYATADIWNPTETIEFDRWYVMYNVGTRGTLCSSGIKSTVKNKKYIPSGDATSKVAPMLVRFTQKADANNQIYIQFGTGDYMGLLINGSSSNSITGATRPYTFGNIKSTLTKKYFWFKQNDYALDGRYLEDAIIGWGTATPTDTLGTASWQLFPVTLSDTPELPNEQFDPTHTYTIELCKDGSSFSFNLEPDAILGSTEKPEFKFVNAGIGWNIVLANDETKSLCIQQKSFKIGDGTSVGDVQEPWQFEPVNTNMTSGDANIDKCSAYYNIKGRMAYLGTSSFRNYSPIYANKSINDKYITWRVTDVTKLNQLTNIDATTLDVPAASDAIYDLQGRRVNGNAISHGVSIVGSKKVVR